MLVRLKSISPTNPSKEGRENNWSRLGISSGYNIIQSFGKGFEELAQGNQAQQRK